MFACFHCWFWGELQLALSLFSVPWDCDELHRNIFCGEVGDNMMSVVVLDEIRISRSSAHTY